MQKSIKKEIEEINDNLIKIHDKFLWWENSKPGEKILSITQICNFALTLDKFCAREFKKAKKEKG